MQVRILTIGISTLSPPCPPETKAKKPSEILPLMEVDPNGFEKKSVMSHKQDL